MFAKFATILLITVHVVVANHCDNLLGRLADSEMRFVYCATTSSVPVKFCTNCSPYYDQMKMAYDDFINSPNNCTNDFFDQDRLNLVSTTEATLKSLWDKAYCDDCFSNEQSIYKFDEKNSSFAECIAEHTKDPCDNCALAYQDLNSFYIQLDQHNNGHVCFDIQDSMNRTRHQWSKVYNCCRREFNMTLFAVAISIFFSLPFIFYGGSFIVTKRQERNHGILNDEDPLFNSSTSATSNRTNRPAASPSSEPIFDQPQPLASSLESTKRPKTNKGFKKLDEDIDESSDEDNMAMK